jgi:PKD repeat protein
MKTEIYSFALGVLILSSNAVFGQGGNPCSITATYSTISPTACDSSNGSATVTPIGGTAPYTYNWATGDSTPTIINVPPERYSVIVTDSNGCSIHLFIPVNSISPIPTIATNKAILCHGDSATLCVTSGYAGYWWNTAATDQCMYATLAGNYYVTVSDGLGCVGFTNTITIDVYPSHIDSLRMNGDTLQGYNGVTYQWYRDGVPISGAVSSVYIVSQAGDYKLSIIDTNGCFSTTDSVHVGCHAFFSIYPDSLNAGVYYGFNQSSGTNLTSYLWEFGDGDTSTLQYPSHTYAQPGQYYVCLTVSGPGCANTYCDSSFLVFKTDGGLMSQLNIINAVTGISALPTSFFGINPNPASDNITISVDDNLLGSTATLTDLTGRKMEAVQLSTVNRQLSTADFASGVYFVTVTASDSRSMTKKLVIQK